MTTIWLLCEWDRNDYDGFKVRGWSADAELVRAEVERRNQLAYAHRREEWEALDREYRYRVQIQEPLPPDDPLASYPWFSMQVAELAL